jgi:ABC-type multidrug transport system fused ATPase/permease subunit
MDIRKDLFSHLVNLPFSFYIKNKNGEILHRINNECGVIRSFLTSSIIRLIQDVLQIIGITVALCWLNYKLFLICLVGAPFLYLNARYFHPKIKRYTELIQEKSAEILSYLMERFENIKLIQSYNRQKYEETRFENYLNERLQINMKSVVCHSLSKHIGSLVTSFGPILIFFLGGRAVMDGTMSLGDLVAFSQYLSRLISPSKDLMSLYIGLLETSVSMKRVFEFLDVRPQGVMENSKPLKGSLEKIKFEKVSLKYNEDWILKDFDLELVKGKTYAMVGQSGCGKSTAVNLLCQFYRPDEGAIFMNGIDTRHIDPFDIRRKISLVSQENQLFHETIEQNIKYGNLESSPEEIKQAAEDLELSSFLNNQEKAFDTIIGDHGCKLSGGQKQRIAIARASLKNADILILDEAIAALDSDSERVILEAMNQKYEDAMIIVISHRLSTIMDVDEIIYMDQGRIIEQGSHEELIKKEGYYWRLFRDQISRRVA